MADLSEKTALEIYEWYFDIERRLKEVVRVVPFSSHAELSGIRSPRLASVLLETASLVDTLFRSQMPTHFKRSNGKSFVADDANITDYFNELESRLNLSSCKSLLLKGVPELISPFEPWCGGYQQLPWWRAYNGVKHDRLSHASAVSLEDCLLALCALSQLMLKVPGCLRLVFRFGWADVGGWNPQIALNDLFASDIGMGYVAYTEFFAIFINPVQFKRVEDIRPFAFRNGQQLQRHLGRLGTQAECE